ISLVQGVHAQALVPGAAEEDHMIEAECHEQIITGEKMIKEQAAPRGERPVYFKSRGCLCGLSQHMVPSC
ncbi:MAG: hypothetical protein P8J89_10820, partial [Phycisphaerales bacterium]|nr:hypothetical protein [Phycisphaerales bacterium]